VVVGDDDDAAVLPVGHAGVGGTEVDTEDNLLGLGVLLTLLLVLLLLLGLHGGDLLGDRVETIVESLVDGVDVETGLVGALSLGELLQGEEGGSLALVSLEELLVHGDGRISIVDGLEKSIAGLVLGLGVLGQGGVSSSTVAVRLGGLLELEGLGEVLNSTLEIVVGEALLAGLRESLRGLVNRLHS